MEGDGQVSNSVSDLGLPLEVPVCAPLISMMFRKLLH